MGLYKTTPKDIQKWLEKKKLEKLLKASENKYDYIRNNAANALGKLGDPRWLRHIIAGITMLAHLISRKTKVLASLLLSQKKMSYL